MRRTKVWVVNLFRAFGLQNQLLNAHVLRLAVLYEDLRIELHAVESEELKVLEHVGFNYRRFYFMRRAIGTVIEFAESFRLLDELADFGQIKDGFTQDQKKRWMDTVAFFKENEPKFELIRNDIGGHFGLNATKHVVENLSNSGSGLFEGFIDVGTEKGGMCFKFAEKIVAVAMSRHKRPDETSGEYLNRTFDLLSTAFEHAVRSTEIVSQYCIFPAI
jgi:hypothetical protein